jgi:hypothetical protein
MRGALIKSAHPRPRTMLRYRLISGAWTRFCATCNFFALFSFNSWIASPRPYGRVSAPYRSQCRSPDFVGRAAAVAEGAAAACLALREKPCKIKGLVSWREMNRFIVSYPGSQVIEIIDGAESAISPNRLFSIA